MVTKAPVCKLQGPLTGYVYVGDLSVALPTTIPGGGIGEEVSVVSGPTLVTAQNNNVTYRFTVKQVVAKVGGSQNFTFDTSYQISGQTYRVRTCFVNGGGSCSSWVNF
ncbi:hypothetical protein E1211_31025 [Micromonospora sp. 15K316]|uniref:hypothetical protein n=1 Tax=Micromonospora sp. 15K316 TaxID=2530376 RepID=UPI00104FC526|nr:hypothetical protein [Micromonospora sp. 15K316]TDC25366.1 hypothetical protein E1211_31025 [Micromonospora sp. 15K316]